ncbi:MAG: alpha/beta hydrolase-fold protein [Acidobacteriota bacterium]
MLRKRLVCHQSLTRLSHLALIAPVAVLCFLAGTGRSTLTASSSRFEIYFPSSVRSEPVDGRLLLMISDNAEKEPRFQIGWGLNTQQIFGADVEGLAPGQPAAIEPGTLGYPRESLADIPSGDYYVQALLNVYETFHRADGNVVKLPMDDREGQKWNRSPGNLYSEPRKVHIDAARADVLRIELTQVIPDIEPPRDTRYIKHIKIQSRLLSEFWGRPMELGSVVLLPEGFDEHPEARYPLVVYQGHFHESLYTPVGFRDEPPGPELTGYDRTYAEYSHKFYQDWTSGRLPRVLIMSIQHANPYYDDSYAVNSANVGPYGDAIVKELIPYVEEKFRALGEPWARVLYGGSTGGWETLAQQVFYPDFFNGAWCNCPDPIDFRAFMLANLYEDENAYYPNSEWKKIPRPGRREPNGEVTSTMEDMNHFELVLGTRGRSTQQFDIWQAVFSPVGDDGYPRPIYDKQTGVIDRDVAEYWKENYDLSYIIRRDWKTLGPKLTGKLHIKVGDMDNYYLDGAVRLLEDFLESTKLPGNGPYYAGTVEYGDGHPHCYSGDPAQPTRISRLTINQRFLPEMVDWMLKTAPPGADVKSWRY